MYIPFSIKTGLKDRIKIKSGISLKTKKLLHLQKQAISLSNTSTIDKKLKLTYNITDTLVQKEVL
jgi:hypothetical protein